MSDQPSLKEQVNAGFASLREPSENETLLSGASIDSTILLDAIGYEPVDFVYGVGSFSFPYQVWRSAGGLGMSMNPQGPLPKASATFNSTAQRAVAAMRARAAAAGATMVIETSQSIFLDRTHMIVEMRGTAVRANLKKPGAITADAVTMTALAARSLVLLRQMGMAPVDFVTSCGFAAVSGWAPSSALASGEIVSLTQGMYLGREAAMENFQKRAMRPGVIGVVGTNIAHRRHWIRGVEVVSFQITGTSVARSTASDPLSVTPSVDMMNEPLSFDLFQPTKMDGHDSEQQPIF